MQTTDVFIVCFDVTNESTFQNVRSWYAEVNQLSPKSPVILVGTKLDRAQSEKRMDPKTPQLLMQDLLMLYNYVEIDATDPVQVKRLVDLGLSYLTL